MENTKEILFDSWFEFDPKTGLLGHKEQALLSTLKTNKRMLFSLCYTSFKYCFEVCKL